MVIIPAFLLSAACAVIPAEAVTVLPRGYWLELHPGDHPAIGAVPVLTFLAYDGGAVGKARGAEFIACIERGRVSAFFAPGEVL